VVIFSVKITALYFSNISIGSIIKPNIWNVKEPIMPGNNIEKGLIKANRNLGEGDLSHLTGNYYL